MKVSSSVSSIVLLVSYLLSDKEIVGEAESCYCDALFFTEHGTYSEEETEREPPSSSQSWENKTHTSCHQVELFRFE